MIDNTWFKLPFQLQQDCKLIAQSHSNFGRAVVSLVWVFFLAFYVFNLKFNGAKSIVYSGKILTIGGTF